MKTSHSIGCSHLKLPPTYKIEGGLCMKCENYYCNRCLDSNYYQHIFSKVGKKELFKMNQNKINKNNYSFKHLTPDLVERLKNENMIEVCFDCVENLNHPSLIISLKAFICK
jgi:hypothetical protein